MRGRLLVCHGSSSGERKAKIEAVGIGQDASKCDYQKKVCSPRGTLLATT